jgi:hypothetical protein
MGRCSAEFLAGDDEIDGVDGAGGFGDEGVFGADVGGEVAAFFPR